MPLNRGKVQNLVITIQDQLLRHVEQRRERIEVGPRCPAAFVVVDPYQYIDSLIKHLVVLRTIQLLSNIREDFLNV